MHLLGRANSLPAPPVPSWRYNPVMGAHGRPTTEAIEDYLKGIAQLSPQAGNTTVGELSGRLAVSPPSATNMITRMRHMGLVAHAPYGGVALTPKGRRIALEIIRHHRLWELYLARRLGLPLSRVHDEAERLEHVLSDEMEARLETLLGRASHDPHGHPIPGRDGSVGRGPEGRRLSELGRSEGGTVVAVSDRSTGEVRALEKLGLLPGVRVRMKPAGFGSSVLTVQVGRRSRRVPRVIAELVQVM